MSKWIILNLNLNAVLSVEHFQIEKNVAGFLNFVHVDKMIKEKKWKKFSQLNFFLTWKKIDFFSQLSMSSKLVRFVNYDLNYSQMLNKG